MYLIDTHAHLEEIPDLKQVIAEARASNIIAIVAVGSDYESNQKVLALAQLHKDFIYPALGLHPWNLNDNNVERNLEFIRANINKAVAIGEIGLDYNKRVRLRAEKELQKSALKEMLKIARTYQKPAIIHSRYAWRDAFNLVNEAKIKKAVFHWYTGTSGVLRDIVNQGYCISATPAVEYHSEHRRAVKEIPIERLMLETDSPVTYQRGTQFEYESRPVNILRTLKGVSELLGISENQIAETTTSNALDFFGLPNHIRIDIKG